MTLAGYNLQDNVYIYSNNKCMCVFLISPVPIAEPLTSELIDTPVFYNLAPRPIKYRVSVPIPNLHSLTSLTHPSTLVFFPQHLDRLLYPLLKKPTLNPCLFRELQTGFPSSFDCKHSWTSGCNSFTNSVFLWKKNIYKIFINYFLVHRKNNSIQVRNDMKGSK